MTASPSNLRAPLVLIMYHVFKKLGKTKRWRAQTLPETPKLMSRSLKAKYVNDGTDEN